MHLEGKFQAETDQEAVVILSTTDKGRDSPDIPFYFSIDFGKKQVIINDKKNNEFGKEQKVCGGLFSKMLFHAGESFDLRVRAYNDKFEIRVDGKHVCDFEHRQPITSIQHLFIDGPLSLQLISLAGQNYAVPYETQLTGGLKPGRKLFISGVPVKSDQFTINLMTSNKDIALHFNARFGEKKVVRNSQQKGEWQNEEKEGKFPFTKEVLFDLTFDNEPYSIQVFVNKERFCSFAHRLDPNSIVGLQVSGDIDLQQVHVI
jgi:hypothetical protein